jgi:hypothetical protein
MPKDDAERISLIRKYFPNLDIKQTETFYGTSHAVVVVNGRTAFSFLYNIHAVNDLRNIPAICAMSEFMRDRLKLPVSRVQAIYDDKFVPFVKYRYVAGVVRPPYEPGEGRKWDRLAKDLARQLAAMHSVRREDLEKFIDSRPDADKIRPIIFRKARVRSSSDVDCGLVRWDVMNIVLDENTFGMKAIIDLDGIHWGDVREDFSQPELACIMPTLKKEYEKATGRELRL